MPFFFAVSNLFYQQGIAKRPDKCGIYSISTQPPTQGNGDAGFST
jgi:hypothetical protein